MADKESVGDTNENNICALCGSFENLRLCARCGDCYYCSKDHQVIDWKSHKRACRVKNTRESPPAKDGSYEKSRSSTGPASTGSRNDSSAHHYNKHVDQMSKSDQDPIPGKSGQTVKKDKGSSNYTQYREKECSDSSSGSADVDVADLNADSLGVERLGSSKGPDDITNNIDKNPDAQLKTGDFKTSSVVKQQNILKTSKMGGLNAPLSEENGNSVLSDKMPPSSSHDLLVNNAKLDPTFDREISESIPGSSNMRSKIKKGKRRIKDSGLPEPVASPVRPAEATLTDYVVKCLNDYGLCVVDNFMAENKAEPIYEEVLTLQKQNALKEGQTVDKASIMKKVRGDHITWVEKGEEALPNIGDLIERMDGLMVGCNGRLGQYNINGRTKAMVACYPGDGTSYKRHVDNPKGDGRCVTCIYYLNKNWDIKRDGGLLRIYPTMFNQVADIEPKFDRLLFFWSDRRNPHEVQPTFRHRFAITVWYFDAEERKRARIQYKISGMTEGSAQATSGQTFEVTQQ